MLKVTRVFTLLFSLLIVSVVNPAWPEEILNTETNAVVNENSKSEQGNITQKQKAAPPKPGEAGDQGHGILPASPGEMNFKSNQVGLAFGIIALMGFLFSLLFWWQQRGEQASYFAQIFHDTMETLEFSRVSAPIDEKWNQKFYLNELLRESSERARNWLAKAGNEKPEPNVQLRKLAIELGSEDALRDIQSELPWLVERESQFAMKAGTTASPWDIRSNRRPGSGYGLPPEWGGPSDGIGRQRSVSENIELQLSEEEKQTQKQFKMLQEEIRAFQSHQQAWSSRAAAQVWTWYQEDREGVRETAQVQAERALNIDFSALRGRGPEFVLEFTAVVVIIFASVILGILKILESEQIGTLLAAIAGYVLGRATTRARAAPELAPTPQPKGTAPNKNNSQPPEG